MADAELAPHEINATRGTASGITLINNVSQNVDLTGAKLPSYFRTLFAGEKRFTVTTSDNGPAASTSTTGRLTVINKSTSDTAKKIIQFFDEDDGIARYKRASTSESAWGPWRQVDADSNGALAVAGALTTGSASVADLFYFGTASESCVLTSNAITISKSNVFVQNNTGSTANLNTINGLGVGQSQALVLLTRGGTGNDVVVKNGTGNIYCGADFTLSGNKDRMLLMYIETLNGYVCISKQDNA